MWKRIVAALLLLAPTQARAQQPPLVVNFGTIQNAATGTGVGNYLNVLGAGSAVLTVNCAGCDGAITTVSFQALQDTDQGATAWVPIVGALAGTTGPTWAASTTTAGITAWQFSVSGYKYLRANITAYSTGTITVKGTSVALSSRQPVTSGGAGSGTVNSGAPPAIAQYSASGTAVGPATISGDATLALGGALTVTKTGGVPFSSLATASPPLSAALGGTGINNGSFTLTLGVATSFPAAPGSTSCLHMSALGAVTTTAGDCLSGTITAGSSPQLPQYQGASTSNFAPITISGDATLAAGGALTVTKSAGNPFGTAAFVNTGTSGGTVPLLNGNLTWSGTNNFTGTFQIGGNALSVGGPTSLPAAPVSTQCLQESSAGAITATGNPCGIGNTGSGSPPAIAQYQGGAALAPVTVSGDATLAVGGALTVTKTNGVAFSAFATAAPPLASSLGGTGVNNGTFSLTLNASTSLPNLPGSTQCLHMSAAGLITTTGSDCAGGGSGTINTGSSPQIAQYQGAGSQTLSGATISGDATLAAGGALSVTKTGGVAFSALATATPPLSGTLGGTGINNGSNTLTVNTPTSLPPAPASTSCVQMSAAGAMTTTGSPCAGVASVQNPVIASGNTQATAAVLTATMAVISTTPPGTGVLLPAAVPGQTVTVVNNGLNSLAVYPPLTDTIDDLPANTPVFVAMKSIYRFPATTLTSYGGSAAAAPPAGAQWYISTTGSDANAGTSFGAAWATPNHAGLTCGDVIHIQSGAYTTQFQAVTQTVSCPASNNVVWLQCDTAFSCTASGGVFFRTSYWGAQGIEVDGITSSVCFSANPSGSATIGYIVFANNVCNGAGYGGFTTYNTGSFGVDNTVIIGNAAYNTSQTSAVCASAISFGGPRNDATSNHLLYAAWNIAWGNKTTRCQSQAPVATNAATAPGSTTLHFASAVSAQGFEVIDQTTPGAIPANTFISSGSSTTPTMSAAAIGPGVGSGDTLLFSQNSDNTGLAWDTMTNYTGTSVDENNLLIGNGTSGLELVVNNGGSPHLSRYNTVASNKTMGNRYGGSAANSEAAFGGGLSDSTMTILYNVVAGIATTHSCCGNSNSGLIFGPSDATPAGSMMDNNFLIDVVSGNGNIYYGNQTNCLPGHTSPVGPFTNSPNSGCSGNSFTTSPAFVNPTVPGAPACSGFTTVAACMATAFSSNWVPTQATAATMGHTVAAPTDANNNTPFLCNIYHALPAGIVPARC